MARRKTPKEIQYEYADHPLDEAKAPSSPLKLFGRWFDQAVAASVPMPHAMILSTVSARKRPEARTVLLKDYSPRGYVFFTNYKSPKGEELRKTPWASLLFYWPLLERQIRLTGKVTKVSSRESDLYFYSRPHNYRIGAWASPQSQVITGRRFLKDRYEELLEKYEGKEIPRPPHWGGYRVIPDHCEFWQGRSNRLHDRLLYEKKSGRWKLSRLAP